MGFKISYVSNDSGITYKSETFEYISNQDVVLGVNNSANILGVSATAIAGAMAEEADSYYSRSWRDDVLDLYALSAVTVGSDAWQKLWFAISMGPESAASWKEFYATDLQTTRTHDDWESAYASYLGIDLFPVDGDADSELYKKVLNPVLMDVGPANFKIWTAIRLVKAGGCRS